MGINSGFKGLKHFVPSSPRKTCCPPWVSESSVWPTCCCSCDTPALRCAAHCNIRPALSCSTCFSLFFFSVLVNSAVTSTDQEQCRIIFSIFFLSHLLITFFVVTTFSGILSWFIVTVAWKLYALCVEFCNPGNSVGVPRSLVSSLSVSLAKDRRLFSCNFVFLFWFRCKSACI